MTHDEEVWLMGVLEHDIDALVALKEAWKEDVTHYHMVVWYRVVRQMRTLLAGVEDTIARLERESRCL